MNKEQKEQESLIKENTEEIELHLKNYKENVERFKEIVRYDYNKVMIKKNIGDEARTFHIMNKSKPLLSPSRLTKIFVEHKFWNIPKKNLIKPRLMGQIIHKLLEIRVISKQPVQLNEEQLKDWYTVDYDYLKNVDKWSNEEFNSMIDEVNIAVEKIYTTLKENKIDILEVEKHVCDQTFHGFIDIIGVKNYNGTAFKVPVIIDLKVTNRVDEIDPSYITQLAVYNKILEGRASCYIIYYNRETKDCFLKKIDSRHIKRHLAIIKLYEGLYR